MRIKHDVNEELVTQYVHDKGKPSRIDGTVGIRGHIPMIIGKDYEMNKDNQPKARFFNNKGG